jgi:ribosome-associated heat shock protein Hsp15
MSKAVAALESVRLDVWLWAARWFKTRALSKTQVESHRVRVDGQPAKPSRAIRVGMRLQIERAGERYDIEVLGLSEDRGPASVAQQLYLESEAARRGARRLHSTAGQAQQKGPQTAAGLG